MRKIVPGDIVQHFKRKDTVMLNNVDPNTYLYMIRRIANHTETGERLVVYDALYPPFECYARPYDMFMSEVDREKYPNVEQQYRFEKVTDVSLIERALKRYYDLNSN